MKNHVVSFFDFHGLTLEPWAEAGFACFAYDLKHPVERVNDKGIHLVPWDARQREPLNSIIDRHDQKVAMACGFPPCTHLAVSGSSHWMEKSIADPDFQEKAMDFVHLIRIAGAILTDIWWLENPVGAISRLWREADFYFDPFQYGGWLPEDDVHPLFPDHIPPRDAYKKRTGIWNSAFFQRPTPLPVPPIETGAQSNSVFQELGGASEKTKTIRSCTPRGFARAVFEANKGQF